MRTWSTRKLPRPVASTWTATGVGGPSWTKGTTNLDDAPPVAELAARDRPRGEKPALGEHAEHRALAPRGGRAPAQREAREIGARRQVEEGARPARPVDDQARAHRLRARTRR